MLQLPAVNGVEGGFESIRFKFGTYSVTETLKELNYKDSMDPGVIAAVHPIRLNRTLGTYTCEADFVCLETNYYDLLTELPDGYTAVIRDITVTKEINARSPFGYNVDVLHNASIIGLDASYKRDDKDGRLVKVQLWVQYITRNAKCLAPQRLIDGRVFTRAG